MRKTAIVLIALLLSATPAFAKVKVVATLPWIGSVADEIGKGQVEVSTLVKPNQDPHMVEARPSMILAVRKADILMYNGLDLEIGYLPVLIESSRNPNIQPGKPGNFDGSHFVTVLEKPVSVDRSMGDVHPLGIPHYHYSPSRILSVAEGMAAALSALDPSHTYAFLQGQPVDIPGKVPGEAEGVERPSDERETVCCLPQALRVSGRRFRIHDHGIR